MNKEIEIIVNRKPIKMNLPPDLQDSKIVIEDDKVFVETGVVDYINNLKFENQELKEENQRLKEEYVMLQNASEEYEDKLLKENQRLNNVLNELEKWLKEERDYYFENYYYIDFNAYGSKLDDVLNKLNELKESDK